MRKWVANVCVRARAPRYRQNVDKMEIAKWPSVLGWRLGVAYPRKFMGGLEGQTTYLTHTRVRRTVAWHSHASAGWGKL